MKKKYYLLIFALIIMNTGYSQVGELENASAAAEGNSAQNGNLNYPKTQKSNQVDDYFGTKVADPYRWLENDTSAETAEWVKVENTITQEYLSQIPYREQIRKRLTQLWNYPKYTVPFKEGKYVFFSKNDGMQNQSILYVQEGVHGTPRELLNPNLLSKDGTVALSDISVSNDAKYLAYSIARAGSDWNEIYILEVADGKKLKDEVLWVKFSPISWRGNGFYYSRYDKPDKGTELTNKNENQKVYYHTVGTPQKADILVYQNKKFPLRNYGVNATEDGRFLILSETESTYGTALYYKDLVKKDNEFKPLIQGFDYENIIVDNVGDKLLLLTNHQAPKYKLMLIDPKNSAPEQWQTIIPETNDVLTGIVLASKIMIAQYMKDATSRAYIYTLEGKKLKELQFPTLGSLTGFNGKKGENIAFYGFTSFTFPTTIYTFDFETMQTSMFYKPKLDFDVSKYDVKQEFYSSMDGTKIPMFIVHKKGLELNGNNPALLYGYGGFNISETPSFSISRLIFLENGGVFALPNIRGGGEYGEDWHEAGTKLKKQNVFDDFIAAAEYLIKQGYTSPEKLAINGGSNGGLLVGACMTQRPDLFKVALPAVGVMDMLRYHKFTIGWAWVSDYGSSDNQEQFYYLLKYSPLHNIKKGIDYPATLITTADHDDRVVPAHSFKFAATLQEMNSGKNPTLIRIETKAGHGAGKPTSKVIDEATDIWSFVFYNLGINIE